MSLQPRNILITVLAMFFLAGCLYDASDQEAAGKLVKELHQDIAASDWDAAMKLYDEEFFKRHSREAWQERLASLQEKYGPLKEVRKIYSQKDPRYSGDFYIYGFKLHFAKATVGETITVLRPLDKETLHIIGHVIKTGKES